MDDICYKEGEQLGIINNLLTLQYCLELNLRLCAVGKISKYHRRRHHHHLVAVNHRSLQFVRRWPSGTADLMDESCTFRDVANWQGLRGGSGLDDH